MKILNEKIYFFWERLVQNLRESIEMWENFKYLPCGFSPKNLPQKLFFRLVFTYSFRFFKLFGSNYRVKPEVLFMINIDHKLSKIQSKFEFSTWFAWSFCLSKTSSSYWKYLSNFGELVSESLSDQYKKPCTEARRQSFSSVCTWNKVE